MMLDQSQVEHAEDEQRVECEYDHRLLLRVRPEGIVTKCRTCKRTIITTWEELKALAQQASDLYTKSLT